MAVTGVSSNTTLAGNFKTKYAERLIDERLNATPILDMVAFKKKSGAIALELKIPQALTHHAGSSFGDAGGSETLRAPVPAQVQYASVQNQEIITTFKIPFGTVAAMANGEEVAYDDLSVIKMLEAGKAILRDQELSHQHGKGGLGAASSYSGSSGTTLVVTFTAASWSSGIWKFTETNPFDFVDPAAPTVKLNTNADCLVTAVDAANRKVTFSANASDVTAISAVSGAVAYRAGATGSTSIYARESRGIFNILSLTSGSPFGLNVASYSALQAVQGNLSSGVLTFNKAVALVAEAVSGNLRGDIKWMVSPKVWGGLMTDQAALRRYPSKPGSFENGAPSVILYTETGALEFVSNPLNKDGEACFFPQKLVQRVGTSDPTDKISGLTLQAMATDTPTWQFDMFAGEALYVRAAAQCGYVQGIVVPS
jgi:hypothetical protein